ncbi:MAG: PIN domain-containing protein [Planctomycetota bacterium]|nr:PIN domain-containing protein [Planctomycetota bacterium]
MTVFMDTYGLIAWINTRDAAHQPVKSYLHDFSGSIVTTEWVLLEFADAFSLSSVKPFAIEAIKRIHRLPMFVVVGYDLAVYQAGFDLYEARPDKDWSLTDCISFAVMTQRGLSEALTADHHFEQAGFRAVFR